MSRSLGQLRAKDALEKIDALKTANDYGNYLAYVKALPATIIMTGLGQALAMEKAGASKSGDVGAGHKNLYQHLNDWLCNGWPGRPFEDGGDLLQQISEKNEACYVRAQAEAMAYLEWLKKFAVAYLNDNKDRGGG